jgi:hypothetical protein
MKSFGEEMRSRLQQFRIGVRTVDNTSRKDANGKHNPSFHISRYRLRELEQNSDDIRVAELAEFARLCKTTFSDMLGRYLSYHPELTGNSEMAAVTRLLPEPGRPPGALAPACGATEPLQAVSRASEGNSSAFWRKGSSYLHARIGLDDLTMWPMVPPGSVVRINTRQRSIAPRGSWQSDYERPIYFLEVRNGFAYGWCDLHDQQLILTPHSLSPAPSRSWIMGREVEVRGRIVGYLVDLEFTGEGYRALSKQKVVSCVRRVRTAVLNSERELQIVNGSESQPAHAKVV